MNIVPAEAYTFPYFPSAYHGEDGVPLFNTGTNEEQLYSLVLWYNLAKNRLFSFKTVYAQSRDDQFNMPSSFAMSLKLGYRQLPDSSDYIIEDSYTGVLGMSPGMSLDMLMRDIYLLPPNRKSDTFEAGDVTRNWFSTGNIEPVNDYLYTRGLDNLVGIAETFPPYDMFFFLTRFCARPMSGTQLRLYNLRQNADSQTVLLIDNIFYTDINPPWEYLHDMNSLMNVLQTTHKDWVRWADEYLDAPPFQQLDTLSGTSYSAEELYTYSDNQLDALLLELGMTSPIREEYPTRRAYVEDLNSILAYYRGDPRQRTLWIAQTDGYSYHHSMTVSPG